MKKLRMLWHGALFSSFLLLGACSFFQSWQRDPLTGGENATMSKTLGVQMPGNFQYYPSHSFVNQGEGQGLETWRGYMDPAIAAMRMFNNLKADGWQLRVSLQRSSRALYVYQKNNLYAIITFHKQGALTIMEIWTSPALPDDSILEMPQAIDNSQSESGNYAPVEEYSPGQVEEWGDSLPERDL